MDFRRRRASSTDPHLSKAVSRRRRQPNDRGCDLQRPIRAGHTASLPKNLKFDLEMENQPMAALLAGNSKPRREARAWLPSHPGVRTQWLAGVARPDGSPLH